MLKQMTAPKFYQETTDIDKKKMITAENKTIKKN